MYNVILSCEQKWLHVYSLLIGTNTGAFALVFLASLYARERQLVVFESCLQLSLGQMLLCSSNCS